MDFTVSDARSQTHSRQSPTTDRFEQLGQSMWGSMYLLNNTFLEMPWVWCAWHGQSWIIHDKSKSLCVYFKTLYMRMRTLIKVAAVHAVLQCYSAGSLPGTSLTICMLLTCDMPYSVTHATMMSHIIVLLVHACIEDPQISEYVNTLSQCTAASD